MNVTATTRSRGGQPKLETTGSHRAEATNRLTARRRNLRRARSPSIAHSARPRKATLKEYLARSFAACVAPSVWALTPRSAHSGASGQNSAREQFGGQHPLCIFYIAAWLKRQERPSQPAGSVASMAGLHQQLGALLGKEVKKIRVTGEVPPRISTIDVVVAITGQTATNAGHYLDRLKANYPEVSSTSTNYCCPRRGRRKLISKPGNEFAPPGARCPKVSSTRTNYYVFRQMSSERRRLATCSFICAPGPFSRVPETSAPRLVQPALTIFPGKGQRRPTLTAQRFSSLGAAICIPGASGPRLVQVALTILHGRGQRKPELTP